jgi:hypothetical protein
VAKKKKTEDWGGDRIRDHFNDRFAAAVDDGTLDGLFGDDTEQLGLYIPHLAARYAFQRETIQFARSLMIYGPPASCKTAWLAELYKWAYAYGGRYLHVDVEEKDAPDLRASIVRTPPDYREWKYTAESMEGYMRAIYQYTAWFREECEREKPPGPGRKVPLVIGVDSLLGKLSESVMDAMDEKHGGAPYRRFGDEARVLNDWFKGVTRHVRGWPILLVVINHDKPEKLPTGPTIHKVPGGHSQNFHTTYKVLLERVRNLPMTADGWEGKRLRLRVTKNAMAPDDYEAQVELVWRAVPIIDPGTGKVTGMTQETLWNWHKATVEAIEGVIADKGERGAAVDDLTGLRKRTGGRYSCRAVGIPTDDPQPAEEVGRLIEADRALLSQLEPTMGIRPGVIFSNEAFDPKPPCDERGEVIE